MNVLLDTCILLDFFLRRAPWHADARLLLRAHTRGVVTCCTTTLSVANIYYIARRPVGRTKALHFVHQVHAKYGLVPIADSTVARALALPGPDFEDNLQIAAAEEAGLDAIVTRNPADFAGATLPVLTPAAFLQQLVP